MGGSGIAATNPGAHGSLKHGMRIRVSFAIPVGVSYACHCALREHEIHEERALCACGACDAWAPLAMSNGITPTLNATAVSGKGGSNSQPSSVGDELMVRRSVATGYTCDRLRCTQGCRARSIESSAVGHGE